MSQPGASPILWVVPGDSAPVQSVQPSARPAVTCGLSNRFPSPHPCGPGAAPVSPALATGRGTCSPLVCVRERCGGHDLALL